MKFNYDAEPVFEPNIIRNCTDFSAFRHGPYISSISQARSENECEVGINAVLQTFQLHPLANKIMISLISGDTPFIFRFIELPEANLGNTHYSDTVNIITINTKHIETMKFTALHEGVHLLLWKYSSKYLGTTNYKGSDYISKLFGNFNLIRNKGVFKTHKLLKLLANEYSSFPSLNDLEKFELEYFRKVIASNHNFPLDIKMIHKDTAKINRANLLEDEKNCVEKITSLSFPSLECDISNISRYRVWFKTADPLVNALGRHLFNIKKIEEYYDPDTQYEEFITFLFTHWPLELINAIYPQIVEQMNSFANRLLNDTSPVNPLDEVCGDFFGTSYKSNIKYITRMPACDDNVSKCEQVADNFAIQGFLMVFSLIILYIIFPKQSPEPLYDKASRSLIKEINKDIDCIDKDFKYLKKSIINHRDIVKQSLAILYRKYQNILKDVHNILQNEYFCDDELLMCLDELKRIKNKLNEYHEMCNEIQEQRSRVPQGKCLLIKYNSIRLSYKIVPDGRTVLEQKIASSPKPQRAFLGVNSQKTKNM